jgi:predicted O-methyltransferase YrrM
MRHPLVEDARVHIDALVDVDRRLKYAQVPKQFRPHCISEPSGHLLYSLVLIQSPKIIVEIGTSFGYSTVWLAAAASAIGSAVVTVDREEERTEAAKRLLGQLGLDEPVTFLTGDALQVLADLEASPEFVLIDATKSEYGAYFEACIGKCTGGLTAVADNMISHREEMIYFLQCLDDEPCTTHHLLTVGKGLELIVYRPNA